MHFRLHAMLPRRETIICWTALMICLMFQNLATTDHVIKNTQILKLYQNSRKKMGEQLLIAEVAGKNQV